MPFKFPVFTKRHLLAGFIAGSLDIAAACIQFYVNTGKNPATVLLYVASGVFGKQAFSGGVMMILAGLVFHFMIALSFSFLFFAIVSLVPALMKQRIVFITVYGAFMWAFVRFCIIPFSDIIPPPLVTSSVLMAILILVVCIALPLSFFSMNDVRNIRS
ncbi:MAG TPA: hypothetical protein VLA58_00375 [Chitinophagaceae bacterium]|nr:hypothetical protein [Chitinophagaceae bacterium]